MDLLAELILPALYRLEIPIPKNPLKATNCYIIKGRERSLIIDTGLRIPEAQQALLAGLDELSVNLNQTDIFVTHMHSDHSGLIPDIQSPTSAVYASAADAAIINQFATVRSGWHNLLEAARCNGFSVEEAQQAIERHPGYKGSLAKTIDFTLVKDGDVITIDDFHLRCIETPGHSPGQVCLYEPDQKLLFSGDHLLGDISPNITHWWDTGNPLGSFLDSLSKIEPLPVNLVLPGHRRIFTDCQGRIAELKQHHQHRLEEAFSILSNGPLTAYQVAGQMTWDMSYRSWDQFPPPQKFFATGEARAHLRHLEVQGLICQEIIEGINYYKRS